MQKLSQKTQGIVYVLIAAFGFSLMSMFVKLAGDLPSFEKAFFRNFVALIFIVILMLRSHTSFLPARRNLPALFGRCFFGTLGLLCNFYAIGKLNLPERPKDTPSKQAAAAVGQCELMHIYDDMFSKYNVTVAQILLTRATLTNERLPHVQNTIGRLLEMGVIPIVNENDTVAIDELELEIGENDSLSATVAAAVGADLLIILSDINGLYSADPRTDANAQVIREVRKIDARIEQMAGGAGSALGSGGMATKINAAKIATEAGVDMVIMNGRDPEQLYALFDGEPIGTHFLAE